MNDHEVFELGDVVLQEGATLRNAKLAYKTFGTLNEDKSNAVVYPTWYSGRHWENEWLIGEGMALDPNKYFVIIPNMLGNGVSSSPSNTPPPYDKARFPHVTLYDNVEVQHRLVTEHFGIEKGVYCPANTSWLLFNPVLAFTSAWYLFVRPGPPLILHRSVHRYAKTRIYRAHPESSEGPFFSFLSPELSLRRSRHMSLPTRTKR